MIYIYQVMERTTIIRVIKILIWIAGLYASTINSLHTLYFIFSGFYFMFTNLGKRQPGTLSAYSVFNDNFERLAGTMDGNFLFKNGGEEQQPPLVQQKTKSAPSDDAYDENTKNQYFRNESKYGNKPCYCGSSLKFKKCCLISQRRRLQEQRLKRIKSA